MSTILMMFAKPWTILRPRTLCRVILQAEESVWSTATTKTLKYSNVRCPSLAKRVTVLPTKALMLAHSWEEKEMKVWTLKTLSL